MDSPEPAAEPTALELPDVDLRELQAEVAGAAAERRGGQLAADDAPRESLAGPRVSPVEATAAIQPFEPLPPGRMSTALKRLVRRALRWYLWPATTAMSRHNAAVSAVIAENRRQLARLDMERERLQRSLDMLRPPRR